MKFTNCLLGILFCVLVFSTTDLLAGIDNVVIDPVNPTFLDDIDIVTFGTENSGGVIITNSMLNFEGNNIFLDLELQVGNLFLITPWDHTENIGPLPVGNYNLIVSTGLGYPLPLPLPLPIPQGQQGTFPGGSYYQTSFEVIPEPVTSMLLLTGVGLVVKRRQARVKC